MKQHMCFGCSKSLCPLWGGQQTEPAQASPDKPRAPRPNVTLPADHTGRASLVSYLQTVFSAGWTAAGLCQTPSGFKKRGSSGQWVWDTQHHHMIPKTSSHLPSMSFLGHHQAVAGSPEPEAPLPSCSTWQARGSHGSTGEGMGIWGCSFANCKPWQDNSCLSCSSGFHSCPTPAMLVCPDTAQVLVSVQVNGLIFQVV